jgi:uncharacterized protein YijF (DUF1287 family)
MLTGQQLQTFWRIKQAKDEGITILQNIRIYGTDHLTWHYTEDLNHVGLIYDKFIYNKLQMAIQKINQQVMIWYSQRWLIMWTKQVRLC